MSELSCKVLIVGGGPGGYVAAIRAGELGLDTVLVEDGRFGGTCLHVGCIPSKAIIHAADAVHALVEPAALAAIGVALAPPVLDYARTVAWKDAIVSRLSTGVGRLLDKAQVRSIRGRATIVDGKTAIAHSDTGDQRIVCEHLVLATGSEPFKLAALPFGGDILSSTDALALTRVPERLAVVGAGYIGMELGMAFAKLGSQVTVIEALPKILPLYDEELTQPVPAAPPISGSRCGRREGGPLREGRACASRTRTGRRRGSGRQGAGRGRAPAAHRRVRARAAGPHDGGALHPHRRPVRDLDAQRLGGRRRDRRADARPPRHGAGRDGRRDHRRQETRIRSPRDPVGLLHRSGDRGRWPFAGCGARGARARS